MLNKSNLRPKWFKGVVNGGLSVESARQEAPASNSEAELFWFIAPNCETAPIASNDRRFGYKPREFQTWRFGDSWRFNEDKVEAGTTSKISVSIHHSCGDLEAVKLLNELITKINDLPF